MAFVAVLFTIGGWQQTNMVAGEVRDPGRTLPRALTLGILVVVAVYMAVNGVYLAWLGRDGLALSQAVAADTATAIAGPRGGQAISVAAMVSIFGFLNVALLTNARVIFAMGREGGFLPWMAGVHPRFGTPHLAILSLGGWSLLLLLASGGRIGTLLSGVVFADWIFFGLGAASLLALRRSRPDLPRPYRVMAYPFLPAFFVLCAGVGVVSAYVAAPRMSLLGTVLLLVGWGVFRQAHSGAKHTS
jgi:APA family basic amino acid/polyamine antiporter